MSVSNFREATARPRPTLPGIPAALWERAAAAPRPVLLLDYDGTLAPFRLRRHEAMLPSRTLELLRAIARRGRTALSIVSGRPVRELGRLLDPLPVHLVGEHGWEERTAGGRLVLHPLPAGAAAALARAAAALAEDLRRRLEVKRASLVLHVRGMNRDQAAVAVRNCRQCWRRAAGFSALRLTVVNGGIELRVPGRDKGVVVEEILHRLPAGVFAVYVGDDRTDEDAFRVVRRQGFAIRVGGGPRRSLASATLPSPAALPPFLARWSRLVDGAARSGGRR